MGEIQLTIGQLSAQTNCKVQTIRYYEEIGLMPIPERTAGHQRRYLQRHLDRLTFVRHSRELGFSLEAVREMLAAADDPDRSCMAVDHIARRQLAQVVSRIARLESLKAELERMIRQCRGGRITDCRIVEALANHAHCLSDHGIDATEPRRRSR